MGHSELGKAAAKGEPIFEKVEFDGEANAFKLVKNYFNATRAFIKYGKRVGFIS